MARLCKKRADTCHTSNRAWARGKARRDGDWRFAASGRNRRLANPTGSLGFPARSSCGAARNDPGGPQLRLATPDATRAPLAWESVLAGVQAGWGRGCAFMAASVVIAARQAQARREAAETPTIVDSEEGGPSPARRSASSADAFVKGMSVLWEQSRARGAAGHRKGRAPNRRSNQFDKAASRLSRSQAESALQRVRAHEAQAVVLPRPATLAMARAARTGKGWGPSREYGVSVWGLRALRT